MLKKALATMRNKRNKTVNNAASSYRILEKTASMKLPYKGNNTTMDKPLWNTFTAYLRQQFGQRVQKIPLDCAHLGSTCPNRDGTLSHTGCMFCNDLGAGSGLGIQGLSISEQWAAWHKHFTDAGKDMLYMAYLQSFSNTYGPIERLQKTLDEIRGLPNMVALSVGTRPDCLSQEKAELLAGMPCSEIWLELGVQSLHDDTLALINRGHDAACSENAIHVAAKAGLKVCAHLMIGLPNEDARHARETLLRLNQLPIHGVKFHNVYVCRNTPLEAAYLAGTFVPPARQDYIELMLELLDMLRSDIIVHRVAADPRSHELVTPAWALKKHMVQLDIEKRIRAKNAEKNLACPDACKSPR